MLLRHMNGYKKLTIELDDRLMDQLQAMAEEDGYEDIDYYATERFINMMGERNSVDVIISIPKHLMEQIDADLKNGVYDSISDAITFVLRSHYSSIGHFLR